MQEHEIRLEELLREQITDNELKELLRRLGEEEFGGPILSTIGDVVEATGKEPLDIGRVLGEIRQEAFEQRFGIKLESHEHRIEQLEDITKLKSPPPNIDVPIWENLDLKWVEETEPIPERVEVAEIHGKEMFTSSTVKAITYLIVIFIVSVILFVAAFVYQRYTN